MPSGINMVDEMATSASGLVQEVSDFGLLGRSENYPAPGCSPFCFQPECLPIPLLFLLGGVQGTGCVLASSLTDISLKPPPPPQLLTL